MGIFVLGGYPSFIFHGQIFFIALREKYAGPMEWNTRLWDQLRDWDARVTWVLDDIDWWSKGAQIERCQLSLSRAHEKSTSFILFFLSLCDLRALLYTCDAYNARVFFFFFFCSDISLKINTNIDKRQSIL